MWREIISEDVSVCGLVVVSAGALYEGKDLVTSMGLKKREKRTRRASGTRRKRMMLETPGRELDLSPVKEEDANERVMVFT